MKRIAAALLAGTLLASAAAAKVGVFEADGDIGAPKHAGSVRVADGRYMLAAGGANMFRAHDEFHFVWRRLKGDFTLTARVAFTGPGKEAHRKAGLMARAALDDAAGYVDGTVHGQGPTAVQLRRSAGADTEMQVFAPPVAGPATIRLERHGRTFTVTTSEAGKPPARHDVTDMALGDTLYVGLFLCAHDADAVETAVFDQVHLTR